MFVVFFSVADKTQSPSVIQECLSMLLASKQTNVVAELIQLVSNYMYIQRVTLFTIHRQLQYKTKQNCKKS